MPRLQVRPLRELGKRALLALLLLLISTVIVWLDRGSYIDNIRHDGVSFVDALYYSTVTMTTTGYGEWHPACRTGKKEQRKNSCAPQTDPAHFCARSDQAAGGMAFSTTWYASPPSRGSSTQRRS